MYTGQYPFVDPRYIYSSSSVIITVLLLLLNTFIFLFILFFIRGNYNRNVNAFVIASENDIKKKHVYVLLAIILIGLGVRLINFGVESMGLREYYYYSLNASSHNVREVIFNSVSINLFHQPVYNLIVYFLSRLNQNEFILRLPSLFCGILTIVVLFKYTFKMFGSRIALISSFLLSLNPMHIYWSREISPYSFYCLLAILSYYFFYRVFIQNYKKAALWYFCSVLLGFFSHYFMWFVILSQLVILVFISMRQEMKKTKENFFLYFLILTIFNFFFIIWIPFLYYALSSNPAQKYVAVQSLSYVIQPMYSLWILLWIIPSFAGITINSIFVFLLVFMFLSMSLWSISKYNKINFLFLSIAISIGLLVIGTYTMLSSIKVNGFFIIWDHNIYLLPLIIIVIAYFFGKGFNKKLIFGFFCLMVLTMIYCDYNLLKYRQKPNLAVATEFVNYNINDGDALFFPNYWFANGFYYYMLKGKGNLPFAFSEDWRDIERLDMGKRKLIHYYGPIWCETISSYGPITKEDKLREVLSKTKIKRVWVVDIREQFFGIPLVGYQNNDKFLAWFKNNYSLMFCKGFEYIKLYLFNLETSKN